MNMQRAWAADRLVAWSQAPGPLLAVITSGLTAVIGNTVWQVLWLLGVVAAALFGVFPAAVVRLVGRGQHGGGPGASSGYTGRNQEPPADESPL